MAGEARTAAFFLSTATVMIGPQASLFDMNVASNSLGLTKNFTVTGEPTYVNLTQGAKGSIISSALTANTVKITGEVYEYTPQNLAYSLGLDGSTYVTDPTSYALGAPITGSTTVPVETATFTNATDVSASMPMGTWIMFQEGTSDGVKVAQLSAATTVSGVSPNFVHTLTFTGMGIKLGTNFTVAARIFVVNEVMIGSKSEQPFLAAVVVPVLPGTSNPMPMYFPKVRITKGFHVICAADNFGNMPFELTPYDVLPSDPFYAMFSGKGLGAIFASAGV